MDGGSLDLEPDHRVGNIPHSVSTSSAAHICRRDVLMAFVGLSRHRVLAGTKCVGGALVLWTTAALITICGLYVWLECGLSMPQRTISDEIEPRGVPRK